MNIDMYLERIDELIQKGKEVLGTRRSYRRVAGEYVDRTGFADFRTSCLAFLLRTFGENSPSYVEFDKNVSKTSPSDVERGIGILVASREEIEGGWLITTKGLLSAEIFSDFLEMAEHLLKQGYKDASAVIIGSVLEEHLRQLSTKWNIDVSLVKSGSEVPKKADLLNAELAKATAYNKLDQKNITSLLDLRNQAAHGHYEEYSKSQVELMLKSVLDFMTRVPV